LPETVNSELVETEKGDENSKETKKIKEPAGKCKKIRLRLNKSQRIILNNWFGTAIWTYNEVVSSILQGTPRIKKDPRAKLINNANFENLPWVTKITYDIRDAAMYKSNFSKHKVQYQIQEKEGTK
jgi:hypothetical protein